MFYKKYFKDIIKNNPKAIFSAVWFFINWKMPMKDGIVYPERRFK